MSQFRNQFSTGATDHDGGRVLTASESSTIVAMLSAGTIFGALAAAPFGDWLGRRISLLICCIIFAFGGVFQVCAAAIPMLLAGR